MRRLRSSVRCSMRLMPGSSARSLTAVRTLSTRSAMMGGLAGFDLCSRFGVGSVRNGIEDGGERRVAYRKTGGGRHEVEFAGGCDGKRLRGWFRHLLQSHRRQVIFGSFFGGGRGDGVLVVLSDERRNGRCGLHLGDLLLLFLLVGRANLVLHLHAELVGGAAELGHEFA